MLSTRSNFTDPDAAYRMLVEAHRDLSEADSALVQAATLLLLANHIGDLSVLQEALATARTSVLGEGMARTPANLR
jgi:hypothetical protein